MQEPTDDFMDVESEDDGTPEESFQRILEKHISCNENMLNKWRQLKPELRKKFVSELMERMKRDRKDSNFFFISLCFMKPTKQ